MGADTEDKRRQLLVVKIAHRHTCSAVVAGAALGDTNKHTLHDPLSKEVHASVARPLLSVTPLVESQEVDL